MNTFAPVRKFTLQTNGCAHALKKLCASVASACIVANVATAAVEGSSNNREQADELEVVIVTAQKRSERLQDVPISIGVLSGRDLDRSSSRGVADVLNQVGGVSIIEYQPGNSKIDIRGVVPDNLLGASTAGFYLDEVPFAFIGTSQLPDANAYDLERVEVLRGPQGTLYGVNALSGVVRVLTNDADLDAFEAKGRARASNTENGGGNYGGDLAVNVPLIPGKLAIRGVASYSDLSGYIDSLLTEQNRINDTQAQAYRLKVNYSASDDLSLKLGLSRSRIDNGAPSHSSEDLDTLFSANQPDQRVLDTYNLIAECNWSVVSLLSSTSYLDYRADTQDEFTFDPLNPTDPAFYLNFFNRLELGSFAQEFRFSSHLQGAWQWSAGALYKDTKQRQYQLALLFFDQPFRQLIESESYAVFGEATRSFNSGRFELTGGLRYFDDRVVSEEMSNFVGPPTAPRTQNFDHVTGRLLLAYKPQADRTLYASVATGFRSGMDNGETVKQIDPSFSAVKPDSLITFEIGAKGGLFGGVFAYDTAIYYTDWKDIQQSVQLPIGFPGGINAGSASGLGIDGSISYHPTRALTLQTSIGWNGLELDQDVISNEVVLYREGVRLNNSAEWTGSVGGSYRMTMPVPGLESVLSSTFTYRSSTTYRFLNGTDLTETQSDGLRTLRASIGFERDQWSAELYGDNLLDDRDALAPPDPNYASQSIRQRPRTIGVQGTFTF